MLKRVLIIGGYGNFGSFIAKKLAPNQNIQLLIAGRSLDKAQNFIKLLDAAHAPIPCELDISDNLQSNLTTLKPDIVIHTSGPFQGQSHHVAECSLNIGAHYIDLADGRNFVCGINALHDAAQAKDVLILSGASSVPCLSSAIIDRYQSKFQTLESVNYGITTSQKTNRGEATTAAVLSYTGKPFTTLQQGKMKKVYGWQNIHRHNFWGVGKRYLGNCDIPDLSLFPKRYPQVKNINFYAGIEIPFIHITLWLLSWGVRAGMIKNLEKAAGFLLKTSFLFDYFGSDTSAFYLAMNGINKEGKACNITFNLTAKSGDGPFIPCMPAILICEKLVDGTLDKKGAYPCMDFVSLEEYLKALSPMDISWKVTSTP